MISWDKMPPFIKTIEVKPYYEKLVKKKYQLIFKRFFDVIFSILLLLFFTPLMIVLAIIVKLDSKGRVFFRQVRITQYGKKFMIHKFRTMVESSNIHTLQITLGSDIRITRIGKFLRKYRLDEVPQLIDILFGNMTFVGCRPEVFEFVKAYKPEWNATFLLPAGLTSLASIIYKDEANLINETGDTQKIYEKIILPAKMKINLKSLYNFSLFNDIKVLSMTIFSFFTKNN